jgi:polyphosphate kinase
MEMIDAVDEEFELELDDLQLAGLLEHTDKPPQQTLDRQIYFRELLRLQGELVKLQDWLAHRKLKLVVLFVGRDAAGKGGVIKRITQRLNPRICRVVALPAPTERERSQWYFQRYVEHLPARFTQRPRNRCWNAPILPKRAGGSWKASTKRKLDSIAFPVSTAIRAARRD